MEAFKRRYTELNDHERLLRNIQRGEERLARHAEVAGLIRAKLAQYKNPWSELRLSYGTRLFFLFSLFLRERVGERREWERGEKEREREKQKERKTHSLFFPPSLSILPTTTAATEKTNRLQQRQGLHRGGRPLHPLLRREARIRPLGRAQGRRAIVAPLPLRLVLQVAHPAGAGEEVRHADQAGGEREEGGGRGRGEGGRRRSGEEGRVEGVERRARRRRGQGGRQGGEEGAVRLCRRRRRSRADGGGRRREGAGGGIGVESRETGGVRESREPVKR